MNVMNRKLFKSRLARDKLNKMGGIMASSQPLMNTVQNFQLGGGVQSTAGTRIPTNPRLADQQRASDIALGRRIKGNLLYPIGEAADLIVNRPAAGLQNLLNDLKYSAAGRFVGASEYGEQKPAPRTGTPARQSIIDYMNTGELRKTGIFRDTQAPEVISSARASEQDSIKRRLESQGYDLSGDQQFSPQPSTLGSMEPDVESMTNPLGRPRTPVEAESDALAESLMPSDMVAPGTREAEEEGMGEGVLSGFTMITGEEQPKTKSGADKPAPAPVSITKAGLQASTAAVKDKTQEIAEFLGSSKASETEKNDAILEQFGYKSPEEEIKGLKKRAELNAQLYRDIAGVDPEEDKKIDGYNLAMMGFMIAAGDSPDALQNIAQGMAKGTSMMMDTKKARQERDRQFKIAGLDKAIKDDEKRKQLAIDAYNKTQDRRFSLLTDALKDARQQQLVMIQLSAKEDMLKTELQAKREIVNDQNLSAEKRAELAAELGVLEKQIAGLGPIGAMAVGELGIADAIEGDNFGNKVDEILNDPTKLAQAQSIASMSKTTKTGPQESVPERFAQDLIKDREWVERNQYAAIETLQSQGIEKPTQNQIEIELRNRAAQQATTPITGGAAAPAAAAPNTVFDTQPSDAALQQLYQQGVRQITIGNQTYPLRSQ